MRPERSDSACSGDSGHHSTEADGGPDQSQWPAEDYWGRRQFVPLPGDENRLHMFVRPTAMATEEQDRILSAWQKMTERQGRARAMAHDLRPSTPRDVRAKNKIHKLQEEGVDVDEHMKQHVRSVVEGISGVHEALRHYSQGENSPYISYLNQMKTEEDRMLVEWSKQKEKDSAFWEKLQGNMVRQQGTLQSNPWQDQSKSPRCSPTGINIEDLDLRDLLVSEHSGDHGLPPRESNSSSQPFEGVAPIDAEPSTTLQPLHKKNGDLGRAQEEHAYTQSANADARFQLIQSLDLQIAVVDRRLKASEALEPSHKVVVRSCNCDGQESFDRLVDLLRRILEGKQRKLLELEKKRAPPDRGTVHQDKYRPGSLRRGQVDLVGAVRTAWNRYKSASDTPPCSRGGSRDNSAEQNRTQEQQPEIVFANPQQTITIRID